MEIIILGALFLIGLALAIAREHNIPPREFDLYMKGLIDKPITEDDMSPMIEIIMFDDFMEDGDLDEF